MTPHDRTDGVLVPAADTGSCLACVRSLGSRGIPTVVAVPEGTSVPATASRHCGETVSVPSPSADLLAYKNALLAFAARTDIRTILPVRAVDAFVLWRHRPAFRSHVEAIWPGANTVDTVFDRLALFEAARAADLPDPLAVPFDDVSDWDRPLEIESRYPVLTEQMVESMGRHDYEPPHTPIHHSPGSPPDREDVEQIFGHLPVVRESLALESRYAVRALYDRGDPLMMTVQKVGYGQSADGSAVFSRLVDDGCIESLARRLLDRIGWHGLGSVRIVETADGEYRLCGLDPYVGPSLALDVGAGADYPYAAWQLAVGDAEAIETAYDVGYGMHSLAGWFRRLARARSDGTGSVFPDSLPAALASLYRHPNFEYLARDDPQPFLHASRYLLG